MRVLIATGLFPPEGGGPATYSKTLLDELPSRGIATSVLPYREVRSVPKILRHSAYFFRLLSRTFRFKPDIIFAQDPLSVGLPAALAAFITRKKFVVKIVGDYAWEQATQRFGYGGTIESFQDAQLPFVPNLMRGIERFVARRALKVIVPSKYLGRIVAQWGVHKKHIEVVYNGIESETVGLKQVIRGLLRYKGKLIISVGRLVPWKGFAALIRVHAILRKTSPDLSLLIIGAGPHESTLEKLAEECGVADSVIFAGNVDRAATLRYMRAADVFVLNTHYEGFSHVLLEASAVGVPIVTTRVGGNPELIEDNVNGYLIKPDDEATLTHRIEKLLSSPETRARIAGNAKKRVEKFSIAAMVEETAHVLKNI
ncbi:MAG: glycosyltransferase family 4 protein [Patescibacteria group bacterium]